MILRRLRRSSLLQFLTEKLLAQEEMCLAEYLKDAIVVIRPQSAWDWDNKCVSHNCCCQSTRPNRV